MTWRELALEVDGREFYGEAVADLLLREADGDCLFRGTQAGITAATGIPRKTVGVLLRNLTSAGLLEKASRGYWLTLPGERSRKLPEFRVVFNGWPGELQSDREAEILSVVFDRADWSGHCPRRALPESLRWTPEDFRDLQRMRLGDVLDKFSTYQCLVLPWDSVRTETDPRQTCGIDHIAGHLDATTEVKIQRQMEVRATLVGLEDVAA